MTARSNALLVGLAVALAGGTYGVLSFLAHGVSARDEPTAVEIFLARRFRHWAIPRAARQTPNPIPWSPEVLKEARAHFADHCALCHANDGGGKTEMGQNLYPKVPDMRLADTQSLSDGEIFSIIEGGIRLTGMPAWGHRTAEDTKDTWKLVHLIRHLPKITPEELEEMKSFNPTSRRDLEEQEEERKFLEGEDP